VYLTASQQMLFVNKQVYYPDIDSPWYLLLRDRSLIGMVSGAIIFFIEGLTALLIYVMVITSFI
jgi:hypothetical protein